MTIEAGATAADIPGSLTRDDLVCPLCEYPLRGLVEPRCPECGHAFDWDEMLHRERTRHPFLFESQPKRNVWSFLRTYVAGFRPKRFFTLLKPSEPIHTRRLMVYWFLCVMLLPLAGGVRLAQVAIVTYQQEMLNWQRIGAMLNAMPANDPSKRNVLANFGSVSNYLAVTKPTISNALLHGLRYDEGSLLVLAAATMLLWPWATFLTLMIFRYSLRLARIRSIHVLRVAIYASDAAMVLLTLTILLFPSHQYLVGPFSATLSGFMFTSLVFAAYVTWRLARAYDRYLRFRHPFWTALASQVIVFLAAAILGVNWFQF